MLARDPAQERAEGIAPEAGALRKIIHIDMDAFYASVEQRDNPELRGQPVAVGGSQARGVVAAASYEARKFGVRSAMPSVIAKRKCPDLIFVKPRFDVYKAVSLQIRQIFDDLAAPSQEAACASELPSIRSATASRLGIRGSARANPATHEGAHRRLRALFGWPGASSTRRS
jgi:nucleotidyltransferase/DNA polymerase involved in DNA repair